MRGCSHSSDYGDLIRIVSARKLTLTERTAYEVVRSWILSPSINPMGSASMAHGIRKGIDGGLPLPWGFSRRTDGAWQSSKTNASFLSL